MNWLALVRQLTEMHGGTVGAHSDGLTKGGEFIVRLPVATVRVRLDSGGVGAGAADVKSVGERGPSRRVLIVDDNHDSAEAMALLLERAGHQAVTSNDGSGAIAKARDFNPDVAIVDIGLPGMDGYEVARQIHQFLPKVVLIALSGWRIDPAEERARKAGFSLYFTKPMEPAKLKEILADLASDTH